MLLAHWLIEYGKLSSALTPSFTFFYLQVNLLCGQPSSCVRWTFVSIREWPRNILPKGVAQQFATHSLGTRSGHII